MKLWQKSTDVNKKIEAFTIGNDQELDLLLAPYDILGSLAHIQMLQEIGLLEKSELKELSEELKSLYLLALKGELTIDEGMEDIHSQVEFLLTQKLGEVGKKIHSGRSRNDQVLVDLKMYFRSEIEEIAGMIESFTSTLLRQSEMYKDVLIPGYTHMQVAMPSSIGLWLGAYAESLSDDLIALRAAYEMINKNPLGSAAGYGSSFPLDRERTTRLLGFDEPNYNVVYAQMTRGKSEVALANALASIATTLAKFSMDVCMYAGQNFGFISFPDELTTGSSIMPHKKNPDVFELVRGRCNQLMSLPNELHLLLSNLPSGYHRDLQQLKEHLFPGIQTLKQCLDIADFAIGKLKVNPNIINDPRYDYLFTVELVNELVLQGMPFRDAYREVGKRVEEGTYEPNREVKHAHLGSLGNLANEQIGEKIERELAKFNFEEVRQCFDALIR
ncbi:argininosuccinate lyase [Marinoscillum furvescens]|uniref:Argininosuccinate lyase n=1 Tax=Marinoscillum furvescens DSM 4134 TaxID=1122208 RepID=A0A3D9KYZ8_MARFU|nr:argininosuccinate lyase [Marinoscillum furvescens]RED93203.1 argininosuccinate lyase [Marinoscillum furvescens DSM 4134]